MFSAVSVALHRQRSYGSLEVFELMSKYGRPFRRQVRLTQFLLGFLHVSHHVSFVLGFVPFAGPSTHSWEILVVSRPFGMSKHTTHNPTKHNTTCRRISGRPDF